MRTTMATGHPCHAVVHVCLCDREILSKNRNGKSTCRNALAFIRARARASLHAICTVNGMELNHFTTMPYHAYHFDQQQQQNKSRQTERARQRELNNVSELLTYYFVNCIDMLCCAVCCALCLIRWTRILLCLVNFFPSPCPWSLDRHIFFFLPYIIAAHMFSQLICSRARCKQIDD